MEKEKQFLADNKKLSFKIGKSFKAINLSRKIFNSLCPACRNMALKDPRTPYENYCPVCLSKITPLLEKLKEAIQK